MATVSTDYLQGLKDGRAALKETDGGRIAETAQAELQFCSRVSRCMGSAESGDYIKGLRDFWTHQLAKLNARGAVLES